MKKNPIIHESKSLAGFEQYWNEITSRNERDDSVNQLFQYSSASIQNVRHPLANIVLAGDLLESTVLNADQRIYIDIILRNVDRAAGLIRDLIDEPENMVIDEYSIHELMDEVLLTLKDSIAEKNIKIDKIYTTLDCKILVNKQKIKEALRSVMTNAINSTPMHNGIIKLITKSINGRCVVEIINNGFVLNAVNIKQIVSAANADKPSRLQQRYLKSFDIFKSNHASVTLKSKEGKATSFSVSFERIQ